MNTIIEPLYDFMRNSKDDRISHYPLMGGSPLQVIILMGSYIYFAKKWGPKFMENRKPFEPKRIMQAYNIIQVVLNSWLSIKIVQYLFTTGFNMSCKLPDYSTTKYGLQEVNLVYFYFMLKVLDLMDTVFIIFRKRYNQASFLHLYHHTIMCIGTQIHTQYIPGGPYIFAGLINSMVHVLMYSYYLLTSVRPELKESIWWKKYITQVQMSQFCGLMVYFGLICINNTCDYSQFWSIFAFSQNFVFFILFSNFYIRAYILKKKNKTN